MTIIYQIGNSLYVNLTNKCPCACTFCVRIDHDTVGPNESLWLSYDPSLEEILEDLKNYDLDRYDQIVFCGYGEPLTRIDTVIEVCKYIREKSKIKIRVNSNGLADLIHNKPTAKLLEGHVDAISISLNAPDKETYLKVARPRFGEPSFKAMLKFAADCKKYIPSVSFSVVDQVITPEEIEACKKLASEMGIDLRVRGYIA